MKELTTGKPIKLIIGFALPVLLGLAFQQAYTLTDTIIIGRQLGENSLAAVGSTASVVSLMFNIINGLVTGFAILIAKNFGAGDHDEMRRTIARTITFSAAATGLIIAGISIFIDPLLHALDTPAGIFDEARTYLMIVCFGLVATLFYNLESAILRAVGDSVIPLVILIISTILNIVDGVVTLDDGEIFVDGGCFDFESKQQFFKITLPLLRPILQYTMVTSAIGGLQMYDIPQLLNEGGPLVKMGSKSVLSTTTVVMLIKKYASVGASTENFGRASAYSVVLFLVTLVVSMIFYKLTAKKAV